LFQKDGKKKALLIFAMMKKYLLIAALLNLVFLFPTFSQTDSSILFFKGATREKRNTLYRNIVQNTITKNLSLPLTVDTEENWMDAFGAIELLRYQSPWINGRIALAIDSMEKRSPNFQRALLELVFSSYPNQFVKQVSSLLNNCYDAKVFAMAVAYRVQNNLTPFVNSQMENKISQLIKNKKDEAIVQQLLYGIHAPSSQQKNLPIADIISREFLKNQTVLFSFQRKNRNYPGLALIRDTAGNFIKDENGNVFSVPQLARSISNLPGYLTNGNTPQGIFWMHGFNTSRTSFIGPTSNIQLSMPFETSLRHFFNDTNIDDTTWTEEWYKKLLPNNLANYLPLYESFYAGKAGRSEIIAHGTTVDPGYYLGEQYYPQTPTMGCLCTKEIWSDEDGKRLESDQQKLVNALQNVGGAKGYCVVIEIDNAQKPITLEEILSLIQSAATL
jgi:hypothetical protein